MASSPTVLLVLVRIMTVLAIKTFLHGPLPRMFLSVTVVSPGSGVLREWQFNYWAPRCYGSCKFCLFIIFRAINKLEIAWWFAVAFYYNEFLLDLRRCIFYKVLRLEFWSNARTKLRLVLCDVCCMEMCYFQEIYQI